MIYVIKVEYKNKILIKIGYTKDDGWDKRYSQYKLHNPEIQVLYKIDNGTEEQEKAIHHKFNKYLYPNYGREWFYENEEILEFFKDITLEKLSELVEFSLLTDKDLLIKSAENFEIQEIVDFINKFLSINFSKDRMKYLCEYLIKDSTYEKEILSLIPKRFSLYYTILGPRRCWNLGYQMSKLENEYQIQIQNQKVSQEDLLNLIYSTFKIGERYLKSDLKKVVQSIYNSLGLKKTGKASDFEEWFELKRVNITNSVTGKREPGFELIKRK